LNSWTGAPTHGEFLSWCDKSSI